MSLIEQAMDRMDGGRRRRSGKSQSKPGIQDVSPGAEKRQSESVDSGRGASVNGDRFANDQVITPAAADQVGNQSDRVEQIFDADPILDADPVSVTQDRVTQDRATQDRTTQDRATPDHPDEPEVTVHDTDGAVVLSHSATIDLNLDKVHASPYLNRRSARTPVMDAFRRIKRPLIANAFGQGLPAVENGRRILVTSSKPAEGKTFTSIHLALSIAAELDTSVILVDADIVKPSVLDMLGVGPRPGIADWFQYPRPTAPELVLKTNIDGFRLLPAGAWKPNSVEALASRSIGGFFDELSAAFPNDIIVIDSPPVLAANETASLASLMGQIVFVVSSGTTSQTEVQQALELLEGDQVISLMLNRSRRSSVLGHYGY